MHDNTEARHPGPTCEMSEKDLLTLFLLMA